MGGGRWWRRRAWGTLSLGACAWLVVETASGLLPDLYKETFGDNGWPLFAGAALLLVAAAAIAVRRMRRQPDVDAPTERRAAAVRTRLLAEVGRQWLPVLDRSLEHTVRLELGLEERPNAVTDPWAPTVLRPTDGGRHFTPGTTLVQLFQGEYHRRLLVLGAPGAGKTTQLLELTRDLLAAVGEAGEPVPVPLLLSRWPGTSLEEWVLEELASLYRIDRAVARHFLAEGDLTLILDGLDEVPSTRRDQCVQAINSFTAASGSGYPLTGLVVSCRNADYEELRGHLGLSGAVFIEPLADEQVLTALRGTPGLDNLLRVAEYDATLTSLLSSPLLLSVAVLAYHDSPVDPELTLGGRARIFDVYTVRMLERNRGLRGQYAPRYEPATAWRALTRFALILRRLEAYEFILFDPLPSATARRQLFPIPFVNTYGLGISLARYIDRAIRQRPLFLYGHAEWSPLRAAVWAFFGLAIGSGSCLLWTDGGVLPWAEALVGALAWGAWSGCEFSFDNAARGGSRDARDTVVGFERVRISLLMMTVAAPPLLSLAQPWPVLWVVPGTWLVHEGWVRLRGILVVGLIRRSVAWLIGVRSLRSFLAFGDDRVLFSRVGHSYRFLHATFLDHLALQVDQALPTAPQGGPRS